MITPIQLICAFLQLTVITLKTTTCTTEIYHIELFPLTINPGYSNAFKECNPQKAHTTGCIVIKELKHIHATLEEEKTENNINYPSDVYGEKENHRDRWGHWNKGGRRGVLKAVYKDAGTWPIEAEFNRCCDVIEARLTAKRKTAFQLAPFRHRSRVVHAAGSHIWSQKRSGRRASGKSVISAVEPNAQGLFSFSKHGGAAEEAQRGARWWTYFGYHGESQEIAYETHHSYKDLPSVTLPEEGWIQIHNRGDLSFHFDKLGRQKQLVTSQRTKE